MTFLTQCGIERRGGARPFAGVRKTQPSPGQTGEDADEVEDGEGVEDGDGPKTRPCRVRIGRRVDTADTLSLGRPLSSMSTVRVDRSY